MSDRVLYYKGTRTSLARVARAADFSGSEIPNCHQTGFGGGYLVDLERLN